jgi:hypothetical protein
MKKGWDWREGRGHEDQVEKRGKKHRVLFKRSIKSSSFPTLHLVHPSYHSSYQPELKVETHIGALANISGTIKNLTMLPLM